MGEMVLDAYRQGNGDCPDGAEALWHEVIALAARQACRSNTHYAIRNQAIEFLKSTECNVMCSLLGIDQESLVCKVLERRQEVRRWRLKCSRPHRLA